MNSGTGGSLYKPTSLDFINRPNPVEPQSVPQKHPLDGTPQLPKASKENVLRLIYDGNGAPLGRPAKRRRSGDGKTLDLPRPPVRQSAKRMRIPPTLSGLHQPPPNAGLLPSISTEQPVQPAEAPSAETAQAGTAVEEREGDENSSQDLPPPASDSGRVKATRNKWSDEETACLLKAVARFGIGTWTKILSCPDYDFGKRTALDLKDRFRVCCPAEYKRPTKPVHTKPGPSPQEAKSSRPNRSERRTTADLQELGINEPFEKTRRRKRHGYSAEEDEALLRGFKKYGKQWAKMRADDELGLGHRTATDLRDRMRTRYPEQYANAGLASRPGVFPKPTRRVAEGDQDSQPTVRSTTKVTSKKTGSQADAPQKDHGTKARKTREAPKPAYGLTFPEEDVFFGLPFDEDDAEGERITLDRGILDWPLGSNRSGAFEPSKMTSIDPIATLNLPRPAPMWPQPSIPQQQGTASSALPSLAAITAFNDSGDVDQLELPSLVLSSLDADGRPSGHFHGIDELLS